MAQLTRSDLESALGFVRDLQAVPDLHTFRDRVLPALRELIPADHATYTELRERGSAQICLMVPQEVEDRAPKSILAEFAWEHPIIQYHQRTRDGRAVKFSDFVSRRELERLNVYNEFLRPRDTRCRISIMLPAPAPLHIEIGLNRESTRDFGERDREMLDLVRPHIVDAYRAVAGRVHARQLVARMEDAVDHGRRGVVLLAEDDGVQFATAKAQGWLERYFAWSADDRLPERLAAWLRTRDGDELRAELPHSELSVRMVRATVPGERDVLLLEECPRGIDPVLLEPLGLTRREAEVMACMASGMRNQDVAGALFISPGTVRKHVEHIYEKLGVRTRSAAVARAVEAAERAT